MNILRKLAMVVVPVVAMSFWAGSASAQKRCATHDGAVAQLAKKYSEKVVGRGLFKGGKTMAELFVSTSGTWTVVVTNTAGTSCIVASGENWFDIPAVPAVVGETS